MSEKVSGLTEKRRVLEEIRERVNRLTPEEIKAAMEAHAARKAEVAKEKKR